MTHQVVYEIFCLMANEKVKKMNISWSDIKVAFVSVYGQNMNRISFVHLQTLFKNVKVERVKMQRAKDPVKLGAYLADQLKLPTNVKKCVVKNPDSKQEQPKATISAVFEQVVETAKLVEENQTLKDRLAFVKAEYIKVKNENLKMKHRIQLFNRKTINQTLKRKDKSIASWISKYRSAKAKLKNVSKLQMQNQELRDELHRLKTAKRKQSKRFKGKYDASNPDYKIVCTNLLRQTKHRVTELSQQVKYWENESATAKDAIEDRTGHITTKQDGKTYKSEIRQASYHLQSLGVSQPNVSPAIRLVVKTVTGAEVEGPLPSYSTNNNVQRNESCCSPADCRSPDRSNRSDSEV